MASTPAQRGSALDSGWLSFAGLLGVMVGVLNALEGFVALFKEDYFVTPAGRLLVFDYTAWGWFWLVVGLIQLAVGFGILAGKSWARFSGILLASLALIGQFPFLSAFPVWSVITIALCVMVIYGLIVAPKDATG